MESQRYVTKHQFTHHFCSRDFAIPMKVGSVCGREVYPSIWTWYQQLPYRRTSLFFMFCKSSRRRRRKSHAGRWLLRLQTASFWLAVVSLAFQGPRPRLLLHRARDSLSDARRQQSRPPTTLFSFVCLFTPHHHSLRTVILHCIHYSPRLYTQYILLAFFLSAATSTSIKCLQTPRSNHE